MDTPISVSLGVLHSLGAKVDMVLSSTRLRKRESKKIEALKQTLDKLFHSQQTESSPEAHASAPPREAHASAPTTTNTYWEKEVREVSYDIDDFLDELQNLRGKASKDEKPLEGRSRRRWISQEISRFRATLEEAMKWHGRYTPDQLPTTVASDASSMMLGMEAARLVGVAAKSMSVLGKCLIDDEEKQLKVVSIVGPGGVGKTNLSRRLYLQHGGLFHCRAFVRSSRKPDMTRLLTSILLQVRPHQLPDAFESRNLNNTIREYLRHKKYFIIIDDIWDSSTWDIVFGALPVDNNYGSRILTTTEVDTVAHRCCGEQTKHIFSMEPLSDMESRELFFRTVTGRQSENSDELHEVPDEIITKCGGFPLAINVTSRHFRRQHGHGNTKEWYNIWNSLSSWSKTNSPTTNGIQHVLNLCYSIFPDHLKACMLYLSVYQEDHVIWKDDLVKQWIAEGFVITTKRRQMTEVACNYFDELVSRGMIQPIDTKYDGKVLSCTVHYMVLDLIRCKSVEKNFVTEIYHSETNIRLADKIRRLSLKFGNAEDTESPAKLYMQQVRSLLYFGLFKGLPSIEEFRLLHVLILHLWSYKNNISFDLTTVSKMFRLRYLEIACNVNLKLQYQLQGLKYLETLKIDARVAPENLFFSSEEKDPIVNELPPDTIPLPGLLHLCIPSNTNLPTDTIEQMTSLQQLGCFDLSTNSPNSVNSLGKLTDLQDLHLTCSTVRCDILEQNIGFLASVLPKLINLRSLTLLPSSGSNIDTFEASTSTDEISYVGLNSMPNPPPHLVRIELSPRIYIFDSLPRWIHELRLLSDLMIAVKVLSTDDVDILKNLAFLGTLSLYVQTIPEERIVFRKAGFRVLRCFKFVCAAPCVKFTEEAMATVELLKLDFSLDKLMQYNLVDAGFHLLKNLKLISAKIRHDSSTDESSKTDLQSALEDAIREHRNRPVISIQWVNWKFYVDKQMTHAQTEQQYSLPEIDVVTKGHSDHREIGEKSLWEDIDSRFVLSLESSPYMQSPGLKISQRRPADGVPLVKITGMIKYLSRQFLKIAGFCVKTEIASINRQRELLAIIVQENLERNPAALLERWVLRLQDMIYDIEDFTDMYNCMSAISSRVTTSNSKRIRWKALTLLHLSKIVPLKQKLKSLQGWQQSATLSYCCGAADSSSSVTSVRSSAHVAHMLPRYNVISLGDRHSGMFQDIMSSVEPELRDLLFVDSMFQDRVIAIVGCRGVGKTTIARAVFDDPGVQENFSYRLWIVASEWNTKDDLLNEIAPLRRDINIQRFLVVIDDLRLTGVWHEIRSMFGKTGLGRRIILTTSVQSVASACSRESSIYRIRGLDSFDSKYLFWRTVGSPNKRSPALDHALEGTLRKCDGLPLALVGAANCFRAKGQNPDKVEAGPQAFEEVNRALMQCYDRLPDYGHRTCLLYLSLFPKGHRIKRKSLIRRWIAEGMVRPDGCGRRSAEEVGADRFDELIDQNIIEPVLTANNTKVKQCRVVNGVMLDFIVNKATSRGFVTLIRKEETLHSTEGDPPVRRLSVHGSTQQSGTVVTQIGLNHVRSLTICSRQLFDFRACRMLRVMDLEGCKGVNERTLRCICDLILLRYLSLRGNIDVQRIPRNIEKLECLETLDIRETRVKKLPIQVMMLPRIAYLFGQFELPQELEYEKNRSKLEASVLQTVSGFVMGHSNGFEPILLHLRFLRKVKIWLDNFVTTDSQYLLPYCIQKSISKDNGLESLSIESNDLNFIDSVKLEGPCMLSSVKLRGRLDRLPTFLTLLDRLSELQLSFTSLSIEDLSVLQHFPRLLYLKIVEGPRAFWGGRMAVQRGGFPSLERLCFEGPELPHVYIHEGGMSAITSLHLLCPEFAIVGKFHGIMNLNHLNEVILHPSVGDKELNDWKNKARQHKNGPKVYRNLVST